MRLRAVLHLHTPASDGHASVERYLAAARAHGVAVVGITDHDVVATPSGWRDGVFLLGGVEVSTAEGDHLLVYGVDEAPAAGLPAADAVAWGLERGAALVAAHPDDAPCLRFGLGAYPFLAWDQGPRLHAVEAWNLGSEAKRRVRNLADAVWLCTGPARALADSPGFRSTARLGVQGGARGAVAGLDSHAIPLRVGPLRLEGLPVEASFATLRTLLDLGAPLPPDDSEALAAVVAALRGARTWAAREDQRPFDGTWVVEGQGRGQPAPGASVSLADGPLAWRASSGANADWVVFRDGLEVGSERGREVRGALARPGLYRVEAHLPKGRVWAISSALDVEP